VGYRNQELQPLRKRLVVRAASTFFTLISGVSGVKTAFLQNSPMKGVHGYFSEKAQITPLDATQMIF
jgi:hypothetical protein